jgi:signal transduction histidine kinase/ActR/RegA family two-component response regulator
LTTLLPANEADRLAALDQSKLLDTASEAVFDDITRWAAQLCHVPIAFISLIDADRQWFKSKVGLTLTEIARDVSFCAHAILQPDELFIVPDTLADERFAANPLVIADPPIRFYAGLPLVIDGGYALGTLCVLDYIPRQLTAEQITALQALCRAVITEIQLRRNVEILSQALSERDQARAALQKTKDEEKTLQQAEGSLPDSLQQLKIAYDQAIIYARELAAEVAERQQVELALQQERALLAQRVAERTAELSAANAELAYAARAKDEFLASMSHELRTPLNAILGLTEALQEQTRGPLNEPQLKSLRTIEASGRHLLALINDILDLSKIEAGKLELQLDPVSIEAICQASLQFIKEAAAKKKIGVSFTLDNTQATMQADARRLKQILVNLLTNAVKFTPEGGQVELTVKGEAEREVIHFIVKDTGIGIASEDLARLFKPFAQVDSSLSKQHEGTGLGLALVIRLTELHGGSVAVESEPGRGSRFIVSLPWLESLRMAGKAKPVEEELDISGFRHIRPAAEQPLILLAEDNEANIELLANYLIDEGFRVVVARNGAEALERAKEERPALILLDVQMPGMDGLEATRRLRADPQLAAIPIIALTGLAMPGDREECLAAGVNDYLSKPVSLKKLVKTIAVYLESIQV